MFGFMIGHTVYGVSDTLEACQEILADWRFKCLIHPRGDEAGKKRLKYLDSAKFVQITPVST